MSPLCEEFVSADRVNSVERFYPLHAMVCSDCFLVQVDEYVSPDEIYSEYAYFSSYSDSWLEHAARFCEEITEALSIDENSFVVELASNDGYLLRNFVRNNIPVLGVEPAQNVAKVAAERGIPTVSMFFGVETAKQLKLKYPSPDLIIGNNVLAHVPDLNDFVAGMKLLLSDEGLISMEFPHLFKLMGKNQYDTIYHEHFSYFSLTTVSKVFASHGLSVVDVSELPTHGGSLRVHVRHAGSLRDKQSQTVVELLAYESKKGVNQLSTYETFGQQVRKSKRDLLSLLIAAKNDGKRIVGYGAPGKGNTLLNYCGIREDFLDFTVDRNEYKHGRYTPGTRIPILPTSELRKARPDYVLVLPWNLLDEIIDQTKYIREWGGKWIVPIPEPRVVE